MSQIQERWPPQGLPSGAGIDSGTLAARPAFGNADVYYWATDVFTLFRDTGAAWEVVSAQEYRRYLFTVWERASSAHDDSVAVGIVHYSPLVVTTPYTVDRIGVCCGAGGTGNFYVAIYDSVGELPVNRLAVSASTAHVVNQKIQVPLTVATLRLDPGYYFIALEMDNIVDAFLYADLYPFNQFFPGVDDGPNWYREDLGGYLIPPAVATPAVLIWPDRAFIMWLRVASLP